MAAHIGAAFHYKDPTWIDRAGASIVVAGLILEGWKYLITSNSGKMPMFGSPEGHSAIRTGLFIIIIGTAIQAYGGPIFTKISGY